MAREVATFVRAVRDCKNRLRATPHRPNQNPVSDWRRAVLWHGGEHESQSVDKQCTVRGTLGGWATRKMLQMRDRATATFRCQTMPISRVNPTHEPPRTLSPCVAQNAQTCSHAPSVRQYLQSCPRCSAVRPAGGQRNRAKWCCFLMIQLSTVPEQCATPWRGNNKCQDNELKDWRYLVEVSTERLQCDDP